MLAAKWQPSWLSLIRKWSNHPTIKKFFTPWQHSGLGIAKFRNQTDATENINRWIFSTKVWNSITLSLVGQAPGPTGRHLGPLLQVPYHLIQVISTHSKTRCQEMTHSENHNTQEYIPLFSRGTCCPLPWWEGWFIERGGKSPHHPSRCNTESG